MSMDLKNAIMLWTGGKDSSLALHEAISSGYQIKCLVTFIPKNPQFLAHPLEFLKYQADSLNLPHHSLEINEPYKDSYVKAINSMKKQYEISTLITGDIAEVNGHPNWIKECCKTSGVEVFTPLWGLDRHEIINKLISYHFKIIFSCVKKPWFTEEWIGLELNNHSLEKLIKLNAETGLDICGENGEYHTLVLDGPLFKKNIQIESFSKCRVDSLIYIDIKKIFLRDK